MRKRRRSGGFEKSQRDALLKTSATTDIDVPSRDVSKLARSTASSFANSKTPVMPLPATQQLQRILACWETHGSWVSRPMQSSTQRPSHLGYVWQPQGTCGSSFHRISPALICSAFRKRKVVIIGDSLSGQMYDYLNWAFPPSSYKKTNTTSTGIAAMFPCGKLESCSPVMEYYLAHDLLSPVHARASDQRNGTSWLQVVTQGVDGGIVLLNRGHWYAKDTRTLSLSLAGVEPWLMSSLLRRVHW